MRLWKAFKSKEEQELFEKNEKVENANFRVCMHLTPKQLEFDLCMERGTLDGFECVTVYTYD